MNILNKLLWFVVDCWRLVMDNRYNPLRHIKDPSIQGYFTMALFVMWSCYFGVVALHWMNWIGYSIVWSIIIHMAVIIPIMMTNAVFKQAEKDGANWVKRNDRSLIEYFRYSPIRRLGTKDCIRRRTTFLC